MQDDSKKQARETSIDKFILDDDLLSLSHHSSMKDIQNPGTVVKQKTSKKLSQKR